MKRYIITGTPGCGKTSLIRALELTGASVVSEAATDLIAFRQVQGDMTPWKHSNFIDDIISLQRHRQIDMCGDYSELHFYDRSPICTYALAIYLGFKPSQNLMDEIERIHNYFIYEKQVFFLENLGFIMNTAARQISFEESLKFEQLHKEVYAKFGYQCITIPAKSIDERVQIILQSI
ncbi:AAA family ATPase [Legionella sp. D16C41]|uniref:AAA family ATPase n=1 Tax=Legionella sp. D16C41 TaxID=3402688 RepID=UPI003AF93A2A